ncbi:hypothetical protein MBCUT_16720 [Methanobrevibacter cuticularis]|uniref:Transglutaminase-like domain-containing protein n=1 Tax=Methanobrevibacter cuticularis TaxID=47311 RepID=A0A166D4Y3_9EURY|nr:transglutaminase domain-containing protein [Methanobrevibacter cuticularis]KZX15212.1 hypothetical protein MBCUT_16720 [Methanobrevibacter cuticularis]
MWLGGGIISRHSKYALLIAFSLIICAVPLSGESIFDTQKLLSGHYSDNILHKNTKSINFNEVSKVGAATKKLPTVGKLSGKAGLTKLQKYMNKNLNHANGGSSSAGGVSKTRSGDCWGLAEWSGKQLKANGYNVRIVQGRSSAASNHRWVQVKINGKWVNFESSLVTKKYGSKPYSKTCAKINKVVKYLK